MQANTLSGVARKGSLLPHGSRTFQWLAVENTSGLDRACVLLPLLQQRATLPKWHSCGLETWHYLFVLYNPPSFFPLPLLFGISVCTGRGRGTECFCGTVTASSGLQWEQQAHREERAEKLELSLHCSSRWSASDLTAELKKWASVSPAVQELESSPAVHRHLDGSDQLPSVFSVTELEVRGAIPWSLEGGGQRPAQTRLHTRGKTPRLIIITFYEHSAQSVIQTLHTAVSVPCKCSRLAKFSETCRSHPHCYQLQRGWTSSAQGQSQLWLVLLGCRADRGSLNRLLWNVSTYAGMHKHFFFL